MGRDRSGLARILTIGGAIALAECFCHVAFSDLVLAQITPDTTLGQEGSVVSPDTTVRGLTAELIEGGALRGANLFHSFSQFNVGEGQRVYFANPAGIENILTRITGTTLSTIFGTLGVDGTANLFLINPNGISFGSNAKLDIAGSFVASTANSLTFGNGSKFSATNPEAPPLLSINLTPGLQYGSNPSKATIVNAGNLAVGKDLTLAAGNLDLQGQLQAGRDLTLFAQDTLKVRDSVTHPFITSAGGRLLLQGDRIVDIFALNHPASGFFAGGDMVLKSPNSVFGDAHYTTGGNFRIEQLDGSLGNLESPGDPIIRASGDVNFNTYRGASLHILAGGSVTIDSITITGADATGNTINPITTPILANVTLSDGTSLVINGTTQPTLDIRAGMTAFGTPGITVTNFTTLLPIPSTIAPATSATIKINSIDILNANGLIFLTNQYQPNTALNGGDIQLGIINARSDDGNGGSVILDSRSSITINPGFISSRSSVGNAGYILLLAKDAISLGGNAYLGSSTVGLTGKNAGNVTIKAGALLINPGSFIDASSRGTGDAGSIAIEVRGTASLIGSFIFSNVEAGAVGQGGTIDIQAGSLLIDGITGDFTGLFANTQEGASGQAGRIRVKADTLRVANNAAIDASTGNSSQGGSITIDTNSFELVDGGQILTSSAGIGKAGNVAIVSADSLNVSNSLITTGSTGAGDSGNLSITTGQLDISNAGQINTSSTGIGNAGNLAIVAKDSIVVNQGLITTGSTGAGDSGNLSIITGRLDVSNAAEINTVPTGKGNAGDLSIAAEDSVNVNNNGLVSTSSKGAGNSGSLLIDTRVLTVNSGGQITTASTGTGNAGDLAIEAKDFISVVNPNSRISTSAVGSTGNSGNLSINTSRLVVSDAGEVGTISSGTGNAGNLAIAAADLVSVTNEGLITTGTNPTSRGNGGTLSISTRQLDVKDKGQIATASTGTGNSGNLSVLAEDSMNVVNQSVVTTSSAEGAGVAGSLDVETNRLSIRDSSLIVSSTVGAGDAGDLTVQAADAIEVVNDSKLSADTIGRGNGGNVTIETNNLSIRNSEVSTATSSTSSGRGGMLNVTASDAVEISGLGGLVTGTAGSEAAGDLTVTTGRLTAQGGGRVEAGTAGIGQGGTVTINASELIELSGRSINGQSSSSVSAKSGAASNFGSGNVNITTGELIVRDGAEVTTETLGKGDGGDVQVQANSLSLTNSGSITSRSEGLGRAGDISVNLTDNLRSSSGIISATSTQAGGGNINIAADDIRLDNSSLISSSVRDSTGGGGDITINSEIFLALEDSDILANANAGPGGNITIKSPGFLADLFSTGQAEAVGRNPGDFAQFRGNGRVDISAESQTGTSGTVTYPNVDPTQGAAELPSDVVDASELIDRRCTTSGSARSSSFTVMGRGGLPPNPNDPLMGESIITHWITLHSEPEKRDRADNPTHPNSTPSKQLVEAQGWAIGANGQVMLTAQANTATPVSPGVLPVTCPDNRGAKD